MPLDNSSLLSLDLFKEALEKVETLKLSQKEANREITEIKKELADATESLVSIQKEITDYQASPEYQKIGATLVDHFNQQLNEKLTEIMVKTSGGTSGYVWTLVKIISWDDDGTDILVSYKQDGRLLTCKVKRYSNSTFNNVLFFPACSDIQKVIRLLYPNRLHNFIPSDDANGGDEKDFVTV